MLQKELTPTINSNSFFLRINRRPTHDLSFYDLQINNFTEKRLGSLQVWGAGVVYRINNLPCSNLLQALDHVATHIQTRGSAVIDALDGHFLFIVIDPAKQKIWVLNNHYQVGNYHYFMDDKEILISTSFTDLVQHLHKAGQVEPYFPAIHNFLANGFNVSDETLIAGVKRSMAGYCLEITRDQFYIDQRFLNNFSFQREPFEDLDSHLDKYIATYQSAIKDYLSAKKPDELGILLSGGHDTSFLMIHSSKIWPKKVQAFSVVFPEWSFDEGPYARNVCEKFGGTFHPIEFKPEHLDQTIGLISACEEPVVGSSLPLYVLSQSAKNLTNTIMGGDAGDTMWGEYYPVGEYHRWVKNLPLWGRKLAHGSAKALRDIFDWERFWELEHVAQLFTDNNFYDGFIRKLCTYRHFSTDFQKQLFKSQISDGISFSKGSLEIPFTKKTFDDDLIRGKLFNGFYTYQSHHTYKGMESLGIDFYMPTIDREVIKFINSLPQNWVNGGNTFQRLTNSKTINRLFHKKALSRYLKTSEIYNRSFDIPWHTIMRPRTEMLSLLKRRLDKRGWYNSDFLNKIFTEFQEQRVKKHELLELKNHGYRIFTLLALELWCIEYLDGRSTVHKTSSLNLEDYLA